MVNLTFKCISTGNHAFARFETGLSDTNCTKGNIPSSMTLEDRGFSNHSSSHTFTVTRDVQSGDLLNFCIWEYVFANAKTVKITLNGKTLTSNSGNIQCCVCTYTLKASDFQKGTPTEPIYLERLSQLQKKSRPITRRSDIFNQYI